MALHPVADQGYHPWTQWRKFLVLSDKQFPAGTISRWEKKIPLMRVEKGSPCVKGSWPVGLRDCRIPSKKHAETHLQK